MRLVAIALALLLSAPSPADPTTCDTLVSLCGQYAHSLEIRITDRDNEIKWLKDVHTKDVEELKKNAPGPSPFLVFLVGAGVGFAAAGILGAARR